MMRLYFVVAMIPLFLCAPVGAQLSPGKLANAHAHLEGLSNCTQCHELGQHIENQKCLNCHQEIKVRIDQQMGFHTTVRDSNCIVCHSDHNGRNFDMIRWPEGKQEKFNHARTGYDLVGKKHVAARCRDCHQAKNVRAEDILDRKKDLLDHTFLGLDRTCESCHVDVHIGQFEKTCDTCHGVDGWKPAEKFDHAKGRFSLLGKHRSVACEKCHQNEVAETNEVVSFVRFRPVAFDTCSQCHDDVHRGQFEETCERCHSTEGWFVINKQVFDHDKTRFSLIGQHSRVGCDLCHGKDPKLTRPTFAKCSDCHKDEHQGQFMFRTDGGRCDACHSERGFLPAQFSQEDHLDTRFPLTGAHQAVPCFMCHKQTEMGSAQFFWSQDRLTCQLCHVTPHGRQFTRQIAQDGCEGCHQTRAWTGMNYDHNRTTFPLSGKHKTTTCNQCHKQGTTKDFSGRVYENLDKRCDTCHNDPHGGQFGARGWVDCATCHGFEHWEAIHFDHVKDSRFSLTGAHESVSCDKCHQPVTRTPGIEDRVYKPLQVACASCHGADK